MKSSSLAFGALVVLLSGGAAYVGTRLALPTPAASDDEGAGAADLGPRMDELERDFANLKRQVDAVQEIAVAARDLAEGLRDRAARAPVQGTSAEVGTAGSPATAAGTGPGEAPAHPEAGMTEEERRAAKAKHIRDTVARDVRALVPAMLVSYADTKPGAEAARRLTAAVEAKQFAVALAVTPEEADKLGALYEGQADRLTREVGPLMRDGFDRADHAAVEAGLTRVWDDMDSRAREILGEERFVKFGESHAFVRGVIRDVLAERRR